MNFLCRLALACYRLALRLYPRSFRRTFGAEMEETFGFALADATQGGARPVLRLLLREVTGVCAHGLTERLRNGHSSWSGVLLALAALAMLATQYAPLVIVLQIVLLPWVLIALLRALCNHPVLQRRMGLAALVVSWAALAFWGALVVERWRYSAHAYPLMGAPSALAPFYTALLSLNLRRIEYGYLIAAASVVICAVRLVRAPRAAGAPAILAFSNLAITWVYLVYILARGAWHSIGAATSQEDALSAMHQVAITDMSLALTLLVSLLLFQTLVPLPESDRWSKGEVPTPVVPH